MANIIWREVFSGNVSKLGYDTESNTLLVAWVKGRISGYRNVPEDMFEDLCKAPSVGSAVNDTIKGKYDHFYYQG